MARKNAQNKPWEGPNPSDYGRNGQGTVPAGQPASYQTLCDVNPTFKEAARRVYKGEATLKISERARFFFAKDKNVAARAFVNEEWKRKSERGVTDYSKALARFLPQG